MKSRPVVRYNADDCSATGREILDTIADSIGAFVGNRVPDDLVVARLRRLLQWEFYPLGGRLRDIDDWIARFHSLDVSTSELAAETDSAAAAAAARHIGARRLSAGRDALEEWIAEIAADSASPARLRARVFAARARAQELEDLANTALPWWARALKSSPNDVEFRLEQARIFTGLGRSDDLLKAYMALLEEELTPDAKAEALDNLAYAYVAKQMNGAATSVLLQALEVRMALSRENPAEQRPLIARLHHALGARYRRDGNYEQAILELEKAVNLFRDSSRELNGAYQQELANALWTAATNYSSLDQLEKAGAAVSEAIELFEEMTSDVPAASMPGLPQALGTLGTAHLRANHGREAVHYFEESVRLLRAEDLRSKVYWVRPSLAQSLSSLGNGYRFTKRDDKAVAAFDEALAIYRSLVESDPPRYLPGLAQTLHNKGVLAATRERHDDAAPLFRETVDIYRQLSEYNSTGFREPLAGALGNLGLSLAQMREWKTAAEAAAEAAEIQESLYRDRPLAAAENLLNIYVSLGSIQQKMQDCPAALLTLARAREILGAEKRVLELNQIERTCGLETL